MQKKQVRIFGRTDYNDDSDYIGSRLVFLGFGKCYGELTSYYMANRLKHKKGEGAGFSWVTAIIVLILSAGVILWFLQAGPELVRLIRSFVDFE